MNRNALWPAACAIALVTGCSRPAPEPQPKAQAPPPTFFKVDPATAATITGTLHFRGKKPPPKPAVDMSSDPACMEAHKGKQLDESLVVNEKGSLANVFVYIKSGLEGKTFETPTTAGTIDQKGCWFHPRILGLQTNQQLQVINSDPVTHNIHPLAQINREWNHSQGQGDAPLKRKFVKSEIMIRVKCNIHSWMRAYIGVVDHPYFAVSGAKGTFEMPNVPPGDYVIEAWHETLGVMEQHVKVAPSAKISLDFAFHGG